MQRLRIPSEIFILAFPAPDDTLTPLGTSPFYGRQEAELAAARLGRGVEVVGYHLVKTVTLG